MTELQIVHLNIGVDGVLAGVAAGNSRGRKHPQLGEVAVALEADRFWIGAIGEELPEWFWGVARARAARLEAGSVRGGSRSRQLG